MNGEKFNPVEDDGRRMIAGEWIETFSGCLGCHTNTLEFEEFSRRDAETQSKRRFDNAIIGFCICYIRTYYFL